MTIADVIPSVPIPRLETERLLLRGFMLEDVSPLVEMCADPETMKYMGGPRERVFTAQNHASFVGHWVLFGYGMWAVEEKESGEFVGRVGLINFDGWPAIEVGWLIGRPWWGRGYAPEAAIASARWAFDSLELDSLCSLIHPANDKSVRVAEKLGEVCSKSIQIFGTEVNMHTVSRDDFVRKHGP